ncbi:hypothetical protein PMAYCL1PPCAC_15408, partial [Pristionchus mayeri]
RKFGLALLIFANVIGCIISSLLLKVLWMTRLHVNSGFLLKVWSTCFLLQFTLHIFLFSLNFSMDSKPKGKADPPIRLTIYTFALAAQLMSTTYEFFIGVERLISTTRPDKYYSRSADRKLLYPVTLLI